MVFTSLVSRTRTFYKGDLIVCGTDRAKGRQGASNSDLLGPSFLSCDSQGRPLAPPALLCKAGDGLYLLEMLGLVIPPCHIEKDKDVAFCVQFALDSC